MDLPICAGCFEPLHRLSPNPALHRGYEAVSTVSMPGGEYLTVHRRCLGRGSELQQEAAAAAQSEGARHDAYPAA